VLGLLSDEQLSRVRERWAQVDEEERRLARVSVTVAATPDGARSIRAIDWLARPEGSYASLATLGVEALLPRALWASVEVRARYRGYIERQRRTAAAAAALDDVALPDALWSTELNGISREALEKLRRWR